MIIEVLTAVIGVLSGVWIGHYATMKAFSHVQPSTTDIIKRQQDISGMEKELNLWESEIEKPVIPDASIMEPREFVQRMDELLKGGSKC